MGSTTAVLTASISAMANIFIVSAVGYLMAIYPTGNPLMPPILLKMLSRLSIFLFSPALIFFSVSTAMDSQLLRNSPPLVAFSILQFFVCLAVARLFRCFHPDQRLAKIIEVAVGTPNQISAPIMVMLSMCKSDVVNEEFGGDKEMCGKTSMGLIFIYAIGFYVTFWGFGYGQFELLQTPEQRATYHANSDSAESLKDKPMAVSPLVCCARFIKKAFLNRMVLAVYVAIAAAFIPGVQNALYGSSGYMRPLGDALETISDPLVCLNCFIMSGSLALTAGGSKKEEKWAEREMEEAGGEQTRSPAPPLAPRPPLRTILIHSFLRLIVGPSIMIALLQLATAAGFVGEEERLIRLIIAVEAAAPSAQMMIVSLNELGIQDMAGSLAFMYIPHYLGSVVTITGWTTFAGHLIYNSN